MEVLSWVPERAPRGGVVEEAEREDVGLGAGGGVHSVGADGGVDDGAFFSGERVFGGEGEFLEGGVGVGGAEVVFGEKDDAGDAVVEADQGVLPVADVIAPADVEDDVAEVVGVEEEPEGVDDAVAFIHGDEDGRRGGAAGTAFGGAAAFGFEAGPGPVGGGGGDGGGDVFGAAEPGGAGFDVVVAGEEDVAAAFEGVELVEVGEVEGGVELVFFDGGEVEFGGDVEEVFAHVAGPELFLVVEID